MPSRRVLLATLGTTVAAGAAGCITRVRETLSDEPPISGSCPDSELTWPTAGGDPGRTGRTDTAPPTSDADSLDLLADMRYKGGRRLADSLPAVADEVAYIPSGGDIVAVDLKSPTEKAVWVHETDANTDAMPLVTCGVVVATGLNRLFALDPATGEQYWQSDVGGHGRTTLGALDGTIFVAGVNPVAVDLRTGDVQWNARGGDTLALGDGGVYTTLNSNGTGGIFAHERNGDQRWHLSLGKIVGSASTHDGTVWVADNEGTVYAIDAATGATKWSRSPTGVGKIHSGLGIRGNDLVVPAGMGEQSAILDAATGETRWSADTGIVTSRPVVGDDWIAFGRTNTGVTVYDRSTGEERATWSRGEYDLGTVDGIVPVEEGFIVRGGTSSGLTLVR